MTTISQLIDILNNNLNNSQTMTYHFSNGVTFVVKPRDTAPTVYRYFIQKSINGEVRSSGFKEDEWHKFYNLLTFLVVDEEEKEEDY